MQTIQLIALVEHVHEPGDPVMVRLVDGELQICNCSKKGDFQAAEDEQWWSVNKCTAEDLPELTQVVLALGGNPDAVLVDFPNCISY